MFYIGVDYSKNSPGICIYDTYVNQYYFIAYLKPSNARKKDYIWHEELNADGNLLIDYQPEYTQSNQNYSLTEYDKLIQHINKAYHLIDLIKQFIQFDHYPDRPITIAFEGVAYNSTGTNNLVDLAAGATILKDRMLTYLNPVSLQTIAPNTIKKQAGKGNMNKTQLFNAFQANSLNDPLLANNRILTMAQELASETKVPKPLDDLVDAYFLTYYISH